MGQITHEDLNLKLSQEINNSTILSKSNEAKIKENEKKISSLPKLQTDFTEHEKKIASTENLGHIKVDGTTIKVNPITGMTSVNLESINTGYYNATFNNNTYEIKIPELTEYKEGLQFVFRPNASNTGRVYLNVNGIGQMDLLDSQGLYLTSNGILRGQEPISVVYTGARFYAIGIYVVETNIDSAPDVGVASVSIVRRMENKIPKLNDTVTSTSTTEATTANVAKRLNDEIINLKSSVSNGKTQVANAITQKGVTTSTTAEFATMASNIGKISTGAKHAKGQAYNTTGGTETIVIKNLGFTPKIVVAKRNGSNYENKNYSAIYYISNEIFGDLNFRVDDNGKTLTNSRSQMSGNDFILQVDSINSVLFHWEAFGQPPSS